jgi:hypothetical protein
VSFSATYKITNNISDNHSPSLYGNNIAYISNVDGKDSLYLWDGRTTKKIPTYIYENPAYIYDDERPSLYKGTIAWENGSNVYYWNGINTQEIGPGGRPSLYDGKITFDNFYQSYRAQGIYYWDGISTNVVNGSNSECKNSSLYNGTVAWENDFDGDEEIYYWDGVTTRKITNNSDRDTNSSLHKGAIAWVHNWSEILYWDGATTRKIADNGTGNFGGAAPSLYNGKIAWTGWDGKGTNIYYWDGEVIHKITDNNGDNFNAKLYEGTITYISNIDGNNNIYYWNENLPIIANAGEDQSVIVGSPITLNGSGTSAPESTIISWNWYLKHQTNSEFDKTATGKMATILNLKAGHYTTTLTVSDNNGATATDTMMITVTNNSFLPAVLLILSKN